MENLTEPQVWAMFGTMSIAFALRSIGALLGLWLALRIAANIRASEEDNMLAKVLGSILAFSWSWVRLTGKSLIWPIGLTSPMA